jgi:hypothetical protein
MCNALSPSLICQVQHFGSQFLIVYFDQRNVTDSSKIQHNQELQVDDIKLDNINNSSSSIKKVVQYSILDIILMYNTIDAYKRYVQEIYVLV